MRFYIKSSYFVITFTCMPLYSIYLFMTNILVAFCADIVFFLLLLFYVYYILNNHCFT